MGSILWRTPTPCDYDRMKSLIAKSDSYGSDTSALNIYLLRKKYNIQISYYNEFLLRKYYGQDGRRGYGYPLGTGEIEDVIEKIQSDAYENNEEVKFCLVDEKQKKVMEKYVSEGKMWKNDMGNNDYIYLRDDLAKLSGKKYHKKKNHVLKFERIYEDQRYENICNDNINDAVYVVEQWFDEHMPKEDKLRDFEYNAIMEAVKYYTTFKLTGGVLYAENKPVAMTIASGINEKICDVHFEKAVGKYVTDGAYAVINRMLACELRDYAYFNREEDINVDGLRKAKMSYHPYMILRKYSC